MQSVLVKILHRQTPPPFLQAVEMRLQATMRYHNQFHDVAPVGLCFYLRFASYLYPDLLKIQKQIETAKSNIVLKYITCLHYCRRAVV